MEEIEELKEEEIHYAFTYDDYGKISGLYVMDADGSNVVNLTHRSLGLDREAAWSPDGKKIAFAFKKDKNWDICTMDISHEQSCCFLRA
jgi:Tol biopolymer transport system component